MGRIEKRLPKKVMDVLEACGWRLNSIEKQDGEYCAEIENWSPAGEDLPETIWYNGTGKGFVDSYAATIPSHNEKHFTMYYPNNLGGVTITKGWGAERKIIFCDKIEDAKEYYGQR